MKPTENVNNVDEDRLRDSRVAWAEALAHAQRDLDYARRSVSALESLVQAYDAAITASERLAQPPLSNLAVGAARNKSYEIGSGERY